MSALRNRELARIHCAAKELSLDEDARRDLMERVAGKRSAAELDQTGRRKVLDELHRLGAKQARTFPGRPENLDERPLLGKIEALLSEGRLQWSYADAIARRMFGQERVALCNDEQLRAVMVALTKRGEKSK